MEERATEIASVETRIREVSGDLPGMLERPTPTDPKPRGSRLSIAIAGVLCLLALCVLLILPLGGLGFAIVLGGIGFVGMAMFHYLTWGRWMQRVLERERLENDNEDSSG